MNDPTKLPASTSKLSEEEDTQIGPPTKSTRPPPMSSPPPFSEDDDTRTGLPSKSNLPPPKVDPQDAVDPNEAVTEIADPPSPKK